MRCVGCASAARSCNDAALLDVAEPEDSNRSMSLATLTGEMK